MRLEKKRKKKVTEEREAVRTNPASRLEGRCPELGSRKEKNSMMRNDKRWGGGEKQPVAGARKEGKRSGTGYLEERHVKGFGVGLNVGLPQAKLSKSPVKVVQNLDVKSEKRIEKKLRGGEEFIVGSLPRKSSRMPPCGKEEQRLSEKKRE